MGTIPSHWREMICSVEGTQYHIVEQTPDKVEVSFVRNYNASTDMVPLSIDKRY